MRAGGGDGADYAGGGIAPRSAGLRSLRVFNFCN